MTSLPLPPTFAQPAIRFLASSPESGESPVQVAAAVIFGAPLDLTESFRRGALGGPDAVRYMSEGLESYSPALDRDLDDVLVRDVGNVQLEGARMLESLDRISAAMCLAARQARLGVMVGGEHTASLGGFRGLKRVHPEAVMLQVDAHLDMRPEYDGEAFTHATWLNHVGQEFGFAIIHQVGLRSGDRQEWESARRHTAWSTTDLSLPRSVRQQIGQLPVYISIDIDVLDPAHAPGTGCPEPGGVTFRELVAFVYSLEGLRVVGLDVMEVSPNLDAANITAAAAAKLIREAILLFGG
ncbi:MAG: agmatinase [Chloroflexota bacterium]|nr:agmatinase [Chloroflexota bacterium]